MRDGVGTCDYPEGLSGYCQTQKQTSTVDAVVGIGDGEDGKVLWVKCECECECAGTVFKVGERVV